MISNNRLLVVNSLDQINILDLDRVIGSLPLEHTDDIIRRASGWNLPPLYEHNICEVKNPIGYIRKIWKIYPISPGKIYLECYNGILSSTLDLTIRKLTPCPLTKSRFRDGFIYHKSGHTLQIQNLLTNITTEYELPDQFYHIVCKYDSMYIAYHNLNHVLLAPDDMDQTLIIKRTYNISKDIVSIPSLVKLNDTQFLISTCCNAQYVRSAHPSHVDFFLFHIDKSEPIWHIRLSHSDSDMKSERGHHLYCILPNRSIAYYSCPSNTLVIANTYSHSIYNLHLGKMAVDVMLPYSNSQVLLSTLTGIYLYNFVEDKYDLLHVGNHKMAIAYINAPPEECKKIVDILLLFLPLPVVLVNIIAEYV